GRDGRSDRDPQRAGAGRPHRRRWRPLPARGHEGSGPGRRPRSRFVLNVGEFSVQNSRIVIAAAAIAVGGGLVGYGRMGRLEDPEFTIQDALITTPCPRGSAGEVAKEVTNRIESAVQQLGQLRRVESESTRGRSVVTAVMKERYHAGAIPQVWDELRRKINDVQPRLPPAVRGRSIVVDDFGDVYGVFLAITGDGYTLAEL